jgi:ABC-type polysaccharide/polyol phosphate export permease
MDNQATDRSGFSARPRRIIATPDIAPGQSDWFRALTDLGEALRRFNLVVLLGASDVASRYRRSALGQLWIALSNAILVVTIGFVWANIWKMPVAEFLPYLAAGHVFWLLLTTTLMDASTIFVQSASYLKELALARSTYILANLVKNLIVFAHNLVILPVVFIWFGVGSLQTLWLLVPALALTTLTLLAASFWIGVLGVRFRDVPNIVASLVTVMFFLTPVIWREQLIEPELRSLLVFNPFHVFLELLRAPLLGQWPQPGYWTIATCIFLLNAVIGFLAFARWRRWITLWL